MDVLRRLGPPYRGPRRLFLLASVLLLGAVPVVLLVARLASVQFQLNLGKLLIAPILSFLLFLVASFVEPASKP
ncbi:MAG TPA: hypothetical protein VKT78_09325 [Fimbriimonadaceae bacterium]|nr:hypothetical protein [Fimbriimonadaceae bacterium]